MDDRHELVEFVEHVIIAACCIIGLGAGLFWILG
jgi:hypothetical protein